MTATLAATVISGFLGAGKTTLVNHLLRNPGEEKLAVLVNDFGAINIDRDLIKVESRDRIELSNGCVCCSIQDDLAAGLVAITRMPTRFTRVVVECSGVSHPAGVLKVFDTDTVTQLFHVDGLFCLIDAEMFPTLDFASTELAIDQAAMSDLVLLNKIDLVSSDVVADISSTLRDAQRMMKLITVVRAEIPAAILFGPREPSRRDRPEDMHGVKHEDAFESASFGWDVPLQLERFERFVAALPPTVLRGKGILSLTADLHATAQRGVFHLVGKRSSVALERSPGPAASKIVLIARRGELDRAAIRLALESCPGARALLPSLKPKPSTRPFATNTKRQEGNLQ